MATNFPSSLDNSTSIPAESANTKLSTNHVTAHQNIQDAIEAIEAKVGVDGSAVTTTHDYKLSEVTSSDKVVGKTATQTLTNKTLTSPVINVGSDATGDTYYRNSSGAFVRLARGTDNYIMKMNGNVPNWEAETVITNASTTTAGIVEIATTAEINAGTGTGATGAVIAMSPDNFIASKFVPRFGGDGSDGTLSLTSGATNIDLAGASFVVKNYTSISITGTGSLTFTNAHANGTIIILKSQGDVTLTSSATPMINAAGLGASGGAGISTGAGSTAGNDGNPGLSLLLSTDSGNGGGTAAVGAGGTGTTFLYTPFNYTTTKQKYSLLSMASGGGSGAQNGGGGDGGTTGAGGKAGGTLVIECAGAFNFTTTSGISVAGLNGGNGTGGSSGSAGGGGGAGGLFLCLYNSLTANTGTVTVSGGTGGNKSSDVVFTAYGGGGGAHQSTAGSSGSASASANAKTGGDGASGTSLILKNVDF